MTRPTTSRLLLLLLLQVAIFSLTAEGLHLTQDLGAAAGSQTWNLVNSNGSVRAAATVPGGIYNDLLLAGVLPEPLYYRDNDHAYRWVGLDDWTYTRSFTVINGAWSSRRHINLVLEGLDTAATVTLNGQQLCGCHNMFVRHVFNVKDILIMGGANTLEIRFRSPVAYALERSDQTYVAPACVDPAFQGECHANQIRKMQASFSWDWGPAFPSVGIWKPIYLEGFDSAMIRDTIFAVNYLPGSHRWSVAATVHAELPDVAPSSGWMELRLELQQEAGNMASESRNISLQGLSGPQAFTVVSTFNFDEVQQWWPNGMGSQPLYDARVVLSSDQSDSQTFRRKLGYRWLSVEQREVVPGEPDKGLTFQFEVNWVPMFSKGSNWIPAHVLPEDGALPHFAENVLHAAAEAGFNMLRVWGGGNYESDRFYELCDELGVLVWQDFMFACSMYPVDSEYLISVREEVKQQVRRLQSHPSLALWAGNNENEAALRDNWYGTQSNYSAYKDQYVQLYVDTIRPVVIGEDPTRSYLVSSPSNGVRSEEEGYIAQNPYSPLWGDIHYYNYLSDGWDANIYPRTRFCSEFGFQSLPSMSSLMSYSAPGDLDQGLASPMMSLRQHHPGGNLEMKRQVENRLLPPGPHSFDTEEALARFIPMTQMYQAMATKTEAECHRRWRGMLDTDTGEGRTMGSLYWQLNDIWHAPTWAGIQHDGAWKMLHYYAAKFYAQTIVSSYETPSGRFSVHVANDLLAARAATLEVNVHSWAQLDTVYSTTLLVDVPAADATEVFNVDLENYLTSAGCGNAVVDAKHPGRARESCFLTLRLLDDRGVEEIAPENFYLPTPLGDTLGIRKPTLTLSDFAVSNGSWPSRYVTAVEFVVTTDAPAPFVWLEVSDVIGRFSDNGFLMTGASRTVTFLSLQPLTPESLQLALSVTSLLDHWPA